MDTARTDERKNAAKYEKSQLELMTTYQLREICRHEKIMNGVIHPLDKEELIQTIMRYMGKRQDLLIREHQRDGKERVEAFLRKTRITYKTDEKLCCQSKIVAYEGLEIETYDDYTISYKKELAGTNAFLIGSDMTLCAILNIKERGNGQEKLYITKPAELEAEETGRKDYRIFCVGRQLSETIFHLYYGEQTVLPEHIEVYSIPLIDFEIRKPATLMLPMAIDFGSVNTTAGVYLDSAYFGSIGNQSGFKDSKENEIYYTVFEDGENESMLLPSIIGVLAVEEDEDKLVFGYDAMRLAASSYVDEGFCVFYDVKRWIGEYEKEEEIVDRQGRRRLVKRSELLRRFFLYIIRKTENRFKCRISEVHISSPVKQKYYFRKMFQEILPEYAINQGVMLDEGMAVLYNTVSGMMEQDALEENEEYEALMIDCGGGTTDLCSYRFHIQDRRAAYKIYMETTYENGDTDFGGNNLTYRIMQVLKIALVRAEGYGNISSVKEILEYMDTDIYRYVDQHGGKKLYRHLDEEYCKAEEILPTRFADFERKEILEYMDTDIYRYVDQHGGKKLYRHLDEEYCKAEEILPTRFADFERYKRSEYYKVKNNFYTLFDTAEKIKKLFYGKIGTLEVVVTSEQKERKEKTVLLDKWKLSFRQGDDLAVKKTVPEVIMNYFEIELLLSGEIYGIVLKFMDEFYRTGRIQDFSFIKLTGQSCKIDLFKDALKEFVPGRMIQFRKRANIDAGDVELKMTCVDGALKYLRDRKYGLADIHLNNGKAVLPYCITAYTHNGKEVVLVDGYGDWEMAGTVSRNMEDLILPLYLKNVSGDEYYRFQYVCRRDEFL